MGVVQRVVKPRTQRAKRALVKREPKIEENCKSAMLMRGANASQTIMDCLRDLTALKKPNATFFSRKNDCRPFEDHLFLEKFSKQHDMSLFAFGSSNKKRPNNLILGRTYDHQLLDMIELGVEEYTALKEFKLSKIASGSKPMLLFSGEPFHTESDYQRLQNLLIDFFRGPTVNAVRLAGLEHVLQFVAIDGKVYMRSYKVLMKKSGVATPRVELEEMGPRIDFTLRRTRLASDDLFKTASKIPPQAKPRKKKNISKNVFGTKMGRIHMQRQDLNKMQNRKMKALKKTSKENKKKAAKKAKT